MPTTPLPRSTPAAEGVHADGVLAFVDALEAHPGIDPHSVLLVRHGKVVAEGWWAPYTADRLHLLYSLSKTFTSTAAGLAVAEGLIDLDDRIVDHFPEFEAEIQGASRDIRIRDALAMATGHEQEMVDAALTTDPAEPVRGFLLNPPERAPGTVFAYNQPAPYSVAAIIQRAAGTDLITYLRPRLLDPLGIGPVSWQQYPPGRDIGFSGLHATTEAIAKLGLLHLQDGVWEGRQLLPEGWAAEVRTKRIDNPDETNPDWRQGYGFQVWMARHGYRGDGAYGQFCVILPEHDVVLATTMATEQMQDVLDLAWQHLLPAFADGTVDAAGEHDLAERLGALALPPTSGGGATAGEWQGEPFSVRIDADGLFAVTDGVIALAAPLGGDWAVVEGDVPIAVSGGADGDTVRIDVLFLESPHRLRLTLRSDGTAEHAWGTTPLGLLAALTPPLFQAAPRPLR